MTENQRPTERPIETRSQDKLERSRFVERLGSALVNFQTKRSTGVVVGITGPWGSGKSSILNLLVERLQALYPDALLVRFDPWLVSGRNDLVAEFLGELIGTIRADEKRFAQFKKVGQTISQYGAQLAPIGNLWVPGVGAMIGGGFRAAEKALANKESLSALRLRLMRELGDISVPIVVLIDELDRIEDEEIRTVAQLVRSVADFPGISYVLAYDAERVMQALGSGSGNSSPLERGRAYLEKIVQLQIPIPVIFSDEIVRLLTSEISVLLSGYGYLGATYNNARFDRLMQLLAEDVIQTPRDISRLVGTFEVLIGMLLGEVDWVDLLAYAALVTKAPATVAKMRRDPDEFLNDPRTERALMARMARDKSISLDDRLQELIPPTEINYSTKSLLGFLFPHLSRRREYKQEHADALCERRPFLTTLRLGLLHGAYSRDEVAELFVIQPDEVRERLKKAYREDFIDGLTDRLEELYLDFATGSDLSIWRGIAQFSVKPDCEWMSKYTSMDEKIRGLVRVLEHGVNRDQKYREAARKIFVGLHSAGENELVAFWLRSHLFSHGLYGCEKRIGDAWFLDREMTESVAQELGKRWRAEHLSGKLLPCRWDLQPVYTLVNMRLWDDSCRAALDSALDDDKALDGFTLLLFGGVYTTDRQTVGEICSLEKYLERAKTRANSEAPIDRTVKVALQKAVGGWP